MPHLLHVAGREVREVLLSELKSRREATGGRLRMATDSDTGKFSNLAR